MKHILSFDSISDHELSFCGGKGASLVKMTKAGLPVPKGYIILSTAFDHLGHGNELIGQEIQEELNLLIKQLSTACTYAVRSSALNEDGSSASFAGAYETEIDVPVNKIIHAVKTVLLSADSSRVREYTQNMGQRKSGIAVVIQQFVKADFAGVLFTSNIISGSSSNMQGNFVRGNGEDLVSGNKNAKEFFYNALKYSYTGPEEFRCYAKSLYKCGSRIRELYGCPMDIEWAVVKGKTYILQARPITTMQGIDHEHFLINDSLSGDFLFSKTNVGEIFMRPVSPMTYSILDSVCKTLGVPQFIDFICGQAYCNISVICSLFVSFGLSKKKAYHMIENIAGKLPENLDIPIFPYNKRKFIRQLFNLVQSGFSKKKIRMSKSDFNDNLAEIAQHMITEIRVIKNNEELLHYWSSNCDPFMSKVLGSLITSLNVSSLLNTQKRIAKYVGDDLANELISGCSGTLESMKPLLMLEDLISGTITKDFYIKQCGHRHVNEMELACPYPYENKDFPQNVITEHLKSGSNVHQMMLNRQNQFHKAKERFLEIHPEKEKWLNHKIDQFSEANHTREDIRSKALKLFCLIREYLLKAAELNHLGDDIFMLYIQEVMQLLAGDRSVLSMVSDRRKNYDNYLSNPSFPNIICGRFEPEKWINSENRRLDFYSEQVPIACNFDIKGFAGAKGVITGTARVILDVKDADSLEKGEILVTTATNIGWTIIFPRAAAIVTDIGAPLSHAAIVAREFGIPAVVGCSNATTLIKTGDIVCVDGSNGTVTKIS